MEDPLGLVGTKIDDKYVVERVVGEGGFAVVYRAQHLIFKRPVAIKAFRALSDFGAEQRERLLDDFVREGALLADLSERSAAIVQARDVGTLTSPSGAWVPYMVLEWLDGVSLDDLLRDEHARGAAPRSMEESVALLDAVAEALSLAHKRGIAHRDVKPANIFLVGEERAAKLLDFGIAKVVGDAQKLGNSFAKTQGSVTSFTPAYGAPEQFSRTYGATGPWTDVFSFALVMGELVAGRAPLDGDDVVQLGFAASNPAVRPTPRRLGATVPDATEVVFEKALAVAPDARYQSAGEFWDALRASLGRSASRSRTELSLASTLAAPPSSAPSSSARPSVVVTRPDVTTTTTADAVVTPPRRSGGRTVALGVAVLALGAVAVGAAVRLAKGRAPAVASAAPSARPSAKVAAVLAPSCPPDMIEIPGGEFFMGSSDPRALDNERPPHSVKLSPYCIDRTEVTVAAYKACSDAGRCQAAGKRNFFGGYDALPSSARATLDGLCNVNEPVTRARHPINCVDWDQASTFCARRGGRLPTEAEWEFAARGPDGRAYPWGDDPPSARFLNACGSECEAWSKKNHLDGVAVFGAMYDGDDGFATTAPVGSFPAGKSRFGLLDVDGNVWEWTADFYAPYQKTPETDPTGPSAGGDRVARGGLWNGFKADWVRPTYRFHFPPTSQSYGVGFRCASPVVHGGQKP